MDTCRSWNSVSTRGGKPRREKDSLRPRSGTQARLSCVGYRATVTVSVGVFVTGVQNPEEMCSPKLGLRQLPLGAALAVDLRGRTRWEVEEYRRQILGP